MRIGKRRLAWQFEHERSDHGKRIYTCKALGYFDRGFNLSGRAERAAWHVTTDAAREVATVIAGKVLQGTAPATKRAGVKFAEAFEDIVTLSQALIASPPVELWPKIIRRLSVPADVEEGLLNKLDQDQ